MASGQGRGSVAALSNRLMAMKEAEVVPTAGLLVVVKRAITRFISIASTIGGGLSCSSSGIAVTVIPTKVRVTAEGGAVPSIKRCLATSVAGYSAVPHAGSVCAITGRVPSIVGRRTAMVGPRERNDATSSWSQEKVTLRQVIEGEDA